MNEHVAHHDVADIVVGGIWSDCAGIQPGGHGQHLEDRARLILHGNGGVELVGLVIKIAVIPKLVQVETRGGGHGEDFARARVHDDDGPVARAVIEQRLVERVFRRGLQVAVNRQDQRGAVGYFGDFGGAVWVLGHPGFHRDARQQVVIFFFHAKVSACIAIEKADDVRGQLIFRVMALQGRLEFQSRQRRKLVFGGRIFSRLFIGGFQGRNCLTADVVRQRHVNQAIGVEQFLVGLFIVQSQLGADFARQSGCVQHVGNVDAHGVGGLVARQQVAVAVIDLAALRVERALDDGKTIGLIPKRLGLGAVLDADHLSDDCQGKDGQQRGDEYRTPGVFPSHGEFFHGKMPPAIPPAGDCR